MTLVYLDGTLHPDHSASGGPSSTLKNGKPLYEGSLGDFNETLEASGNDDVFLQARRGDDTVIGANGNDDIQGNAGNDWVFGLDGTDHVSGNEDDDVVHGGAGDDFVFGDAGDDAIAGGGGNDYMETNAGIDRYADGGAGNDFIAFNSDDPGTVITSVPSLTLATCFL